MKLNLGCGRSPLDGYVNVDLVPGPGVNVVFDLDWDAPPDPHARGQLINNMTGHFTGVVTDAGLAPEPVTEIVMSHSFEHITPNGQLNLMEMLYDLAAPGASCTILCPHGASDDAFEDPTHRRPLFPFSFIYFAQPTYWMANYGYRGDWQLTNVVLAVDKKLRRMPEHELAAKVDRERNVVLEMMVQLQAVKPARPQERLEERLPVLFEWEYR